MIFEHIERDLRVEVVKIEEDYYWAIHPPELYDPAKEPANLTIGQLYEDWEFLANMRHRQDAVSPMLDKVAPLLRYLGQKIGQ